MADSSNIGMRGWAQRLAPAIAVALALLVPVAAEAADADWGALPVETRPTLFPVPVETEIGMRYWGGFGETGKTLYESDGVGLASRLTYRDLNMQSGEIYGQIVDGKYFSKGFVGLGGILRGSLQDEDFPPGIDPYSSTLSDQNDGGSAYIVADGGAWLHESPGVRVGVFGGWSYLYQQVNAYGCAQTETNQDVCVPPVPTDVGVITQQNNWNSLRVGLNTEATAGPWKLRAEGAFLPLVWLYGADSHLLRICGAPGCFTGPIPEDGTGWGYQLQATLDYQVTDRFSVGVGGRYWHMQTRGNTHFEGHVVDMPASPQPVEWSTTAYGLLAQAAMQF